HLGALGEAAVPHVDEQRVTQESGATRPGEAKRVVLAIAIGIVERGLEAADLPGIGYERRRLGWRTLQEVTELGHVDVERDRAQRSGCVGRRADRQVESDELVILLVDEGATAVAGQDRAVALNL